MSETGITDYIYNHIFLSSLSAKNVRIFKIKSNVESVFGNDLDLFIKDGENRYKWFVFQAKVMDYNGAFKDLKRKKKGSFPQWTKLQVHQKLFDSEPYYLFYCGQPKTKTKQISGNIRFKDFLGKANYRELGIAAVTLNDVIKNRKGKGGASLTYFNEFFPKEIKAFRHFFSNKYLNTESNRYYELDEIIDNNYYNEIDTKTLRDNMNDNYENFDKIITDKGEGKTRIILEFKE